MAVDCAIGGRAQSAGGPFDKDGLIRRYFKPDGAIRGTAQKLAESTKRD
jgi:hypothetical protein